MALSPRRRLLTAPTMGRAAAVGVLLAALAAAPPTVAHSNHSGAQQTRRGGASGAPKEAQLRRLPQYDECFSVSTNEADFLVNSTVVVQTIAQDSVVRRSSMAADGSLVHGYLQQIKRCDLPLGEAWYASVGGPALTQLQCTNSSINPAPADCQWTPFWGIQANASGPIDDTLDGIRCSRWEWWSGGAKYGFWGTAAAPLRTAKLFETHPGWLLWEITFSDFRAGPPPLSAFELKWPQSHCPPAEPLPPPPPPSSVGGLAPSGLLRLIESVDARSRLKGFKSDDAGGPSFRFASILGDGMVLQSAPLSSVVWGFAPAAAEVTVHFGGKDIAATRDTWLGQHTWLARLPPTPASFAGRNISATSSSGGPRISLAAVVFGDVWLCAGQSNMDCASPALLVAPPRCRALSRRCLHRPAQLDAAAGEARHDRLLERGQRQLQPPQRHHAQDLRREEGRRLQPVPLRLREQLSGGDQRHASLRREPAHARHRRERLALPSNAPSPGGERQHRLAQAQRDGWRLLGRVLLLRPRSVEDPPSCSADRPGSGGGGRHLPPVLEFGRRDRQVPVPRQAVAVAC